MFFAKIKLSNEVAIEVDADSLEFTSVCPVCGKESPIEMEDICDFADGIFASVFCNDCADEMNRISPMPEGQTQRDFPWFDLLTKSDYPSDLFNWALHNASKEFLNAAADWMVTQVPGYHHDQPLADISTELERRQKEGNRRAED